MHNLKAHFIRASEPAQEPTEDIDVLHIPLRELMGRLLSPGADARVDIKLFGIIPFLQRRFPDAF